MGEVVVGLRGTVPALAEEALELGLSRFARGLGVCASKARSGPVPLPLGFTGAVIWEWRRGSGIEWARSWSGSAEKPGMGG